MATVRFALVGVCYISEEHARLSGPPHHRDTLGEERVLAYMHNIPYKYLDNTNLTHIINITMVSNTCTRDYNAHLYQYITRNNQSAINIK